MKKKKIEFRTFFLLPQNLGSVNCFYETEKYDFYYKIIIMNNKRNDITFRGRYLGVIVPAVVQYIVGIIHISFGLIMLSGNFSIVSSPTSSAIYSLYTLVYGFLVFVFTYLFWKSKRSGWIGTIIVSLFVILADTLTVLGVLSVLGIPKIAAIGEIPFSALIIFYLLQNHVRSKYKP